VNLTKRTAAGVLVSKNGAMHRRLTGLPPGDETRVLSVKPKALIAEPAGVSPAATTTKASRRPARTASKLQKLVCRYCGSDDLAPSFKKRRDARCRACFKQRYGSSLRGKHDKPAGKAKAAKS
jgi:hypothetical protein